MRLNRLVACVVLLAIVVGFLLGREFTDLSTPAVANGQAIGGTVLIAAANTQNEAMCFLFDTSTKQLVSYMQRKSGGYRSPEDVDGTYEFGDERALINIGSVGQPRDGDTRSTFATLNESVVSFHRVEYDFRVTQEKIRAIPELPDYLADRLAKGR